MQLTPSLTSYYFTKGKAYTAKRYNEYLATLICDKGHQRFVSLARLGERCGHLLQPVNRDHRNFKDAFDSDNTAWLNAGYWIAVEEENPLND